MKILLWDNQAG